MTNAAPDKPRKSSTEVEGLAEAIQRADRVILFAHDVELALRSRPSISFDQFVVLNFQARAMSSLRAVRILIEHGLGGDALTCMRTIVELDIDLAYILLEPASRLEAFYEYRKVSYARMVETNPGAVSAEAAAEAFALRDEVAHLFKDPFKWTPDSIRKRAQAAGRTGTYATAYALGSESVHSGLATLTYSLQTNEAGEYGLMTTEQMTSAQPLNFGALALFRIACSVAEYCKLDVEAQALSVQDAITAGVA